MQDGGLTGCIEPVVYDYVYLYVNIACAYDYLLPSVCCLVLVLIQRYAVLRLEPTDYCSVLFVSSLLNQIITALNVTSGIIVSPYNSHRYYALFSISPCPPH